MVIMTSADFTSKSITLPGEVDLLHIQDGHMLLLPDHQLLVSSNPLAGISILVRPRSHMGLLPGTLWDVLLPVGGEVADLAVNPFLHQSLSCLCNRTRSVRQ